jgi:hypothetical protein
VPAPANGDQQAVLAGEADGSDDVGRRRAPGDDGRAPVDRAVPDAPDLVVAGRLR